MIVLLAMFKLSSGYAVSKLGAASGDEAPA